MSAQLVDSLHAACAISDSTGCFARLMARLAGSGDGSVALAAALTSRASAEGDICLDLARLAGGSISAGETAVRCPDLEPWVRSLRKSPVVGAPGDWRPLVLDGTRLYLYRHWDAEQSLARFLRERSQAPAPGVDMSRLQEGIGRLFPVAAGGRTGSGSQRPWRS